MTLMFISSSCLAQRDIGALRQRPQNERYSTPEAPGPLPQNESFKQPSLPSIPTDNNLASKAVMYIKQIKLTGNEHFSRQQLGEVVSAYEGRNITAMELQDLRQKLTLFYVQRGYINSGAIIENQQIIGGVITLKIIEGQLSNIEIRGNDWLKTQYLKKRLRLGSENILDFNALKERIQLLHQDRLIDRINARLKPGLKPGNGNLSVNIDEKLPYELGVSFNNWRSPSIGSIQGEIYAAHYNVTGYGDQFTARYARTGGMNNGSASYSFPLTVYDTRIKFFYDHSDGDIIEEQFRSLDITSKTKSYGARLSHPFYHTPQTRFEVSLGFEKRSSESRFSGQLLPVENGSNGISKVSVLRFAQDWVTRSPSQVIAARSTFSVGIDAFDATINAGELPDGQFFTWAGQFQWITRLWDTNNQLVFRSHLQLAANPLLSLEKSGMGGATTVRGYRENTFVRDNAWVSSIELRFPLIRLSIPGLSRDENDGMIQLATFYDFGWGENNSFIDPDLNNIQQPSVAKTLSSVGVGLRWAPHKKIHSEIYWGYALRNTNNGRENDLQDLGVHFLVNMQVF